MRSKTNRVAVFALVTTLLVAGAVGIVAAQETTTDDGMADESTTETESMDDSTTDDGMAGETTTESMTSETTDAMNDSEMTEDEMSNESMNDSEMTEEEMNDSGMSDDAMTDEESGGLLGLSPGVGVGVLVALLLGVGIVVNRLR